MRIILLRFGFVNFYWAINGGDTIVPLLRIRELSSTWSENKRNQITLPRGINFGVLAPDRHKVIPVAIKKFGKKILLQIQKADCRTDPCIRR
jgi:hypothetical protein